MTSHPGDRFVDGAAAQRRDDAHMEGSCPHTTAVSTAAMLTTALADVDPNTEPPPKALPDRAASGAPDAAEMLKACLDSVQAGKEVTTCFWLLSRPCFAAHERDGCAGAGEDRRRAAQVRARAQLVPGKQAMAAVVSARSALVIPARACPPVGQREPRCEMELVQAAVRRGY